MGKISISPSEDGPEVKFDEENKIFKISGNSYPENCEKIYEPIKQFLEDYNIEKNKKLNFEFHFNLINSTSTVYLAQIIMKISKLSTEGLSVFVKWHYDRYDEELLELGEKLASISNLPFVYIPIDED